MSKTLLELDEPFDMECEEPTRRMPLSMLNDLREQASPWRHVTVPCLPEIHDE